MTCAVVVPPCDITKGRVSEFFCFLIAAAVPTSECCLTLVRCYFCTLCNQTGTNFKCKATFARRDTLRSSKPSVTVSPRPPGSFTVGSTMPLKRSMGSVTACEQIDGRAAVNECGLSTAVALIPLCNGRRVTVMKCVWRSSQLTCLHCLCSRYLALVESVPTYGVHYYPVKVRVVPGSHTHQLNLWTRRWFLIKRPAITLFYLLTLNSVDMISVGWGQRRLLSKRESETLSVILKDWKSGNL